MYGTEGVGKSTWADGAPDALFIGAEEGTNHLESAKLPSFKTWEEFLQVLHELLIKDHKYKTLVIDTVDSLEPLLQQWIVAKNGGGNMNTAAGGYGNAYKIAAEEWLKVIETCRAIRDVKNMNIIFLGHALDVERNDPMTDRPYNRYVLNLHEGKSTSSRAVFKNNMDSIFFANYEVWSSGEGKETRGHTSKDRKMYTQWDAKFDAKTRLNLPAELPLSWDAFEKALSNNSGSKDVYKEVLKMASSVTDEEIKKKAIESVNKYKNNNGKLMDIKKRLEEIVV